MSRSRLLPAATLTALLSVAGVADAATVRTFDATLDADVRLVTHVHAEDHQGAFSEIYDHDLDFKGKVHGRLGTVTTVDGRVQPLTEGRMADVRWSGTAKAVDVQTSPFGSVTRRWACTGDGKPDSAGTPGLWSAGSTAARLRILTDFSPEGTCTSDEGGSPRMPDFHSPTGYGDLFDATFDLPLEAQDAGKTIQLVSGASTPETCPKATGYEQFTTRCELTWKGKLTLVRTGGSQSPGETPTPVPSPPAPGTPPGTTPPGPSTPTPDGALPSGMTPGSAGSMTGSVSDAIDGYLHPSSGDAKVDAVSKAVRERLRELEAEIAKGKAGVELTCPTACSGSVTAYPGTRAAGKPLGRAPLKPVAAQRRAGAGATATASAATRRVGATIRFDRADRRRIARTGRVVLRVSVRPEGAAKAVSTTVKLKVPRR